MDEINWLDTLPKRTRKRANKRQRVHLVETLRANLDIVRATELGDLVFLYLLILKWLIFRPCLVVTKHNFMKVGLERFFDYELGS